MQFKNKKKLILILILFLIISTLIIFKLSKHTLYQSFNDATDAFDDTSDAIAQDDEETENIFDEDGRLYCFVFKRARTNIQPYTVEEHIKLQKYGNYFKGSKTGTQSGPDMTNGYFGSLLGEKTGEEIKLIFSYTIEGSENKELEIYEIKDNNLVKKRYPLLEGEYQGQKMLVPNETDQPEIINYEKENCKLQNI